MQKWAHMQTQLVKMHSRSSRQGAEKLDKGAKDMQDAELPEEPGMQGQEEGGGKEAAKEQPHQRPAAQVLAHMDAWVTCTARWRSRA